MGRRWVSHKRFLDEVYIHTMPVPASDWREWAGSDQFLKALRQRFEELDLSSTITARLLSAALSDEGWRSIAALDAATRLVRIIKRSGGLDSGTQAARALELFFHNALTESLEEVYLVSRTTLARRSRLSECSSSKAGEWLKTGLR